MNRKIAVALLGLGLMTGSGMARAESLPVIRLAVDATDVDRAVLSASETIAVTPGVTARLRFPKWLPGAHGPIGPVSRLAGLTFTAAGKVIPWRRDPLDGYTFLIDVPPGVDQLNARFQFLSAIQPDEGRIQMSPAMMLLEWNQVSLYPADLPTSTIPIQASVKVPAGWQLATALEREGEREREGSGGADGEIHFKPVSYETLIDSPVLAGRHFRREDLGLGVALNIVADRAEELAMTPAQLVPHRELVNQALHLFGPRHFDHYDFLLGISDRLGKVGLEHHRSSEDITGLGYFKEWATKGSARGLLPHEFVHSWNGKHRAAADIVVPDFNTPLKNDLLWVYEGQTQFWSYVLQARSGLATKDEMRGAFALLVAQLDNRAGRQWRPLADTTNEPIISARRPQPWRSYQRAEDYYIEGALLWLDADMLIRERSGQKRSLDDFARIFFGGRDGDWSTVPYTRSDVVSALNQVLPYDWESFIAERVDKVQPHPPLGWLARGGYRLVWSAERTSYAKTLDESRKSVDLSFSLGLILNNDGTVSDVIWDSPAFRAKVVPGAQILAVDGETWSADRIRQALDRAAGSSEPIRLTIKRVDAVSTVELDYHGGQRYPSLQPLGKGPAPLDRLLDPLK